MPDVERDETRVVAASAKLDAALMLVCLAFLVLMSAAGPVFVECLVSHDGLVVGHRHLRERRPDPEAGARWEDWGLGGSF